MRSLAAEAVNGGRVHLNGARVKAAKPVRAGDTITVRQVPPPSTLTTKCP
jgi:ribosome-associated heat shock protein Hsp15